MFKGENARRPAPEPIPGIYLESSGCVMTMENHSAIEIEARNRLSALAEEYGLSVKGGLVRHLEILLLDYADLALMP